MSTTFDLQTVTNSIAALSISGVTVKDSDEIATTIGLGIAVLCPRPDSFITNLTIVPAELSKQNLDATYTLNYIYYHCKIGGDFIADYSAMLTKIALLIKAFSNDAVLTGALDNGEARINRIGPVQDGSGNTYHGCEISIDIKQFLEV